MPLSPMSTPLPPLLAQPKSPFILVIPLTHMVSVSTVGGKPVTQPLCHQANAYAVATRHSMQQSSRELRCKKINPFPPTPE